MKKMNICIINEGQVDAPSSSKLAHAPRTARFRPFAPFAVSSVCALNQEINGSTCIHFAIETQLPSKEKTVKC
jgi:hypothetical protein